MDCYTYEFYEDKNGQSPTYGFLESLKEKIVTRNDKQCRSLLNSIYIRLKRLEENGTRDGMPDFEFIDSKKHKLWQIRIKHATGLYRLFICQCPWQKSNYVILNYFVKDESKTPKREIDLAERLIDDYITRRSV